jgi:hypothetical protein
MSRRWSVQTVVEGGHEYVVSVEESTNLPLEIQSALETLLRRVTRVPTDLRAVDLLLRRGSAHHTQPFADFSAPRRRAAADPRQRIHGGRSIARFTRRNDPASLRFARGFEPDFRRGVVETASSISRLYGGAVRRFRILSANGLVQYLFFAAPSHAWIGACQSTARNITSFGIRAVDPVVDEELLIPGYEYDLFEEGAGHPELLRQIPKGFAGAPSPADPLRADTSAWLERVPAIREFRRAVLGEGGRA